MDSELIDVAALLAGTRVTSLLAAKSGGNSQVYRVETPAGRYALKAYPSRAHDERRRAEIEWRTLHFLRSNGVTEVPRPIAREATGRFILMEWIEGAPIVAHNPEDIAQAAGFIARVFALSREPDALAFPLASEACLSAAAIIAQINQRLALLSNDPDIDRFLRRTFDPLFQTAASHAAALASPSELAAHLRRLIPADFGFHNALREADGRLRCIDFEYFGWDDPVKLTADFVLHPAMNLNLEDQRDFVRRMAEAVPADDGFRRRLRRHLPLFAVRWILILFNPFRRDRQEPAPETRAALLEDRLAKAAMLARWVREDAASAVASDRLRV